MAEIKAIETLYNGYRFRSRLEARWAVFFDAAGIPYEYEPEGFVLYDGTTYLPDFYLPWFKAYVEIKRPNISEREYEDAVLKCTLLHADGDGVIVLLCKGDPVDMNMEIFCTCYDDDEKLCVPCRDQAVFVEGAWWNELNEDGDYEERGDSKHHISIAVGDEFSDDGYLVFPHEDVHQFSALSEYRSLLEEYRLKSRRARFEHGEKPLKTVAW